MLLNIFYYVQGTSHNKELCSQPKMSVVPLMRSDCYITECYLPYSDLISKDPKVGR